MADLSVFECRMCFSSYNETSNKPLSLPCGHVYWEACISNQANEGGVICPADKTLHRVNPKSLPCCYAIMMNLPNARSKELCCSKHTTKKVKFYCKTHDQFLCSDWVIEHTGQGHDVIVHAPTSLAISAELDDLKTVFTRRITEAQEAKREAVSSERQIASFYDKQIQHVDFAFEKAMKDINIARNTHVERLSRIRDEQIKQSEIQQLQSLKLIDQMNRVIKQMNGFHSSGHVYEEVFKFIKRLQREAKRTENTAILRNNGSQFCRFKESKSSHGLGKIVKTAAKLDRENIDPSTRSIYTQKVDSYNNLQAWSSPKNAIIPQKISTNPQQQSMITQLQLGSLSTTQGIRDRRAQTSRNEIDAIHIAVSGTHRSASNTAVKAKRNKQMEFPEEKVRELVTRQSSKRRATKNNNSF